MKNTQPLEETAEVKVEALEARPRKAELQKAEPPKAEKPEAPTFTIEQLRADARALFGIAQSTYDGATHGLDRDQMFTVEAMKEHIERWLKEEY